MQHKFLLFLILLSFGRISAQNFQDTMEFGQTPISKYSYFLNDTYVTLGFSLTGIHYSNNFRNLSSSTGFVIGLEHYIPTTYKFFANVGLNISSHSFNHRYHTNHKVRFSSLYLDVPITVSFELPALREYDFRMILGLFGSARLGSWTRDSYISEYINSGNFTYDTSLFRNVDMGWTYGASIEFGNYLLRVRGFTGWIKVQGNEQGMNYSFNLDFGYFFYRKSRNKK
mgnify:CR=1 FL=1